MNDSASTTAGRRPLELAWFGALCDDDYQYLGVPDERLLSSWDHCGDIVRAADHLGFDNVLLPSGYQLGIDTIAFASAIAPQLQRTSLLAAIRCGENWPPQLARQLATLDHLLGGRLTINIISSDLPGAPLESAPRYRRTLEVMGLLRSLLNGEAVSHHGEFFDLEVEPPRLGTVSGTCPPFYFGGFSEAALDVAARAADVYLMWPDTVAGAAEVVRSMTERAAKHGRTPRFGFRCHVIVRETESAAREAAASLIGRLDADAGAAIRAKSLDTASAGVARQAELREGADDDGFAEDHLWTGVGRARSGAGAAIVGDPDQVADTIRAYADLGIDCFILSGYPHLSEAQRFALDVMGRLR